MRGAQASDSMTLDSIHRFRTARLVTGRQESARSRHRHPSAPSGTIRHSVAPRGTVRTDSDGEYSGIDVDGAESGRMHAVAKRSHSGT